MNIESMTIGELQKLMSLLGKTELTTQQKSPGRCVVVVDRGWIYAGDWSESGDYVRLDNAVWVFRWESIGFAAMLDDWKNSKVDIRKSLPVEIPKGSIIFRVPVDAGWGAK